MTDSPFSSAPYERDAVYPRPPVDIPSRVENAERVVRERYLTDPIFHALVQLTTSGGYADDDGLHHDGPTLADALRVQRILDALDSIGYEIHQKGTP